MLVKGHSGFGVELIGPSTIRKSARGPQAARLRHQIDKQIAFHQAAQFERIVAPAIQRVEGGDEVFHADMDFIAADDFVEFLSEAGRDELDDLIDLAIGFIRRNLAACKEADVAEPIAEKLDDLAAKGVSALYIAAARQRTSAQVIVPVGPCHGDLTLSNMLFKGRRLYLIDFLDCFVESPLQDIVKLRQDTAFAWSLHLYPAEFDATKIRLTLAYLDRGLVAAFAPEKWYARHYELFQLVNLMRILPYCREPSATQLVTDCLDRLLSNPSNPSL
jgi:hypothetical protein